MKEIRSTIQLNNMPLLVSKLILATLKLDTQDFSTVGVMESDGRLLFSLPPSTPPHGAWIHVEASGAAPVDVRIDQLPADPAYQIEGPYVGLKTESTTGAILISGDRFITASGDNWMWRGSTDFRLPERVGTGVDVKPILLDRIDVGANLVRMLSMKVNNTGWEFSPRRPDHSDISRWIFDLLGDLGMFGEWVAFADTRYLMRSLSEQLDYYAQQQEVVRDYPHIFLELVNEDKHPTQDIDSSKFGRPSGILASHGSGLSDVQPVTPFWDYATYHARRTPPPPNAKPFNNMSPYEFNPEWPHPVPFVCEESVKPENYVFNPAYAAMMGRAARLGPGATFHHNAWNDARLFSDGERACARAFFTELLR